MSLRTVICLLLFNNRLLASTSDENETVSLDDEWIKAMIPSEYFQNESPPVKPGSPLIVYGEIGIWFITSLTITEMEFESIVYLTLEWKDDRLQILEKNDIVTLGTDLSNNLWTPQMIFRNSKGTNEINFNPTLNRIDVDCSKKTLSTFLRMPGKFYCNFDLRAYPLDSQICFIHIEVAYDNLTFVQLKFNAMSKSILSGTTHPEFLIKTIDIGDCTVYFTRNKMSCVELVLSLERLITYHILNTYLPSLLVVILSWISFWIDVDVIPARMALGLTSLLTLSTQFSNVNKGLPPVSYIKAIDIWMFTCMFMIFASLIEFAVSNTINRKRNKMLEAMKDIKFGYGNSPKLPLAAVQIDGVAKIVFPTIFLFFNLAYWGYFLVFQKLIHK